MKTSVPTRVALLAAVVLVCYWPTLHGGFIFDDNVTLTENPLIRGARGISDIWFSRKAVDYWPVTSTSFWLEWRLWGTNASGYHVTNVIIHFCDCLLFWALLKRLRFQGAFFATLLFALHPLNAETVAWITQRKNLLSMFFFLISAHCFATGALREKIFARWIAVSLLAFVLAMLCKGSVVTMPLVLVGLVAWHRRLKRGDLVCFALFSGTALVTAAWEAQFRTLTQSQGVTLPELLARVAGAGAALAFYLRQAIWPHPLIFVYPKWKIDVQNLWWWLPLVIEVSLTWLLWRIRSAKVFLFAWGYVVVALLPVLGLVQVGYMKYSLVSDHYEHLALLGITALAGTLWARIASAPVRTSAATIVLAVFGFLTWNQTQMYADARTLYSTTIALNPACWLAENNLGALDLSANRPQKAIGHFEAALQLNAADAGTENNLGLALARLGHLSEAIEWYSRATQIDPGFSRAENNWGIALAEDGRTIEAIGHFRRAILLDSSYFEGQLNLGRALAIEGDFASAREHYEAAERLNPQDPRAREALGKLSGR